MHIFVGSTNPVKINAVSIASAETWPNVLVEGVEVASGVSHQPMNDDETRKGAENRAKAALVAGQKEFSIHKSLTTKHTFLGIGLEGGVFEHENGELWNTVWVCVADTQGDLVCANGERFCLPSVLTHAIRSGKEMGPAMDEIAGTTNIKHQQGMIGIITRNFIDRTEMYAGLAKLALGLWYGREWESLKKSKE